MELREHQANRILFVATPTGPRKFDKGLVREKGSLTEARDGRMRKRERVRGKESEREREEQRERKRERTDRGGEKKKIEKEKRERKSEHRVEREGQGKKEFSHRFESEKIMSAWKIESGVSTAKVLPFSCRCRDQTRRKFFSPARGYSV